MRRLLMVSLCILSFPFAYAGTRRWRKYHSTGNYSMGHKPAYQVAHELTIGSRTAREMEW